MRKILFVLLCSLLTAQVFGYDFKDEGSGLYYNITSNSEPYTVEVTSGDYSGMTTVAIPETVTYNEHAYSVASIGYGAFEYCSGLTSVNIPNSVTSIGEDAFYNVKYIDYNGNATGSPWGAISMNGIIDGDFVYFDADKKNLIAYIGAGGEITIPNSVTSIGEVAFRGCIGLTSIAIPNSVASIGYGAFEYCSGLTSVTIPNSVTSIGDYAFYNCTGLKKVNVESIEGWLGITFDSFISNPLCYAGHLYIGDKEVTDLVIPNSVTSIGSSAFSGCSGLSSVTIPNSVASIGSYAFYNCSGLTSVTIPNSVTSIGSYAFEYCSGLTSVTIPNSVTSIGSYAFRNVKNIVYSGTATYVSYDEYWGAMTLNGTIDGDFIYSDAEKKHLSAYIGKGGDVVIPDNVVSIEENAFYNCSDITSVTIPNSVTSIGSYAFEYCSGLTSVTIPNSVTSIGSYAFRNVKNIVYSGTATYESYDEYWGAMTLNGTIDGDFIYSDAEKTQLSKYIGEGGDVIIPNTVTSIGSSAFSGCSGLTSVTIPNSVTSIGDYAFSGCDNLQYNEYDNAYYLGNTDNPYLGLIKAKSTDITSCEINANCKHIYTYAFSDCSGLTSVTIPNSVTSIGKDAFWNVKNIVYNGTATYVFYNEYWGALFMNATIDGDFIYNDAEKTQLAKYIGNSDDVTIPNSVTSIGSSAFSGCSGLSSVTIPNSVTSIGNSAFAYCSGLTSVTIPNSVTRIGDYAFRACSGLTSITIPNAVTEIGPAAFYQVKNINYNGNATGRPWGAYLLNGTIYQLNGFVTDQYSGMEEITYEGIKVIRLVVPNNCSLPWDAQLITPSWRGLDGQVEGASFCLSFDYKCTADDGYFRIASGKNYPYNQNYNQDGNTQIVDDRGTPVVYAANQSVTTEWQHYDYDYYIGAEGEDSIRLEIDCGAAGGDVYFKNFVLKIDGKVVAKYYCTETLVKNNITYNLYKDGTATVASANVSGSVTIEGSVTKDSKTYTVTGIGYSAFKNCTGITSITIPNTVTSIGEGAFYNCSGLTSVTIPNSVTRIGDYAFRACSGLTSITIPNTVTEIGPAAFYQVKNINYNGNATGRPWGAYLLNGTIYQLNGFVTDQYSGMEEITDEGIKVIRLVVPNNCSESWDAQLITPSWRSLEGQEEGASFCLSFDYKGTTDGGNFRIASGKTYPYDQNYNQGGNTQIVNDFGTPVVYDYNQPVTTDWQHYDYDHFIGAEGADSIRLEIDCGLAGGDIFFKNFVLKIEGNVVAEYYTIANEIWENDDFTYNLYEDGTATVISANVSGRVTIEGSVTKENKTYNVISIGSGAFKNCRNLTSITIPNTVKSIGDNAFYGCSGLTSITIPNSVTSIGSSVFWNCDNVTIKCQATSKPSGWNDYWNSDNRPVVWGATMVNVTLTVNNASFGNVTGSGSYVSGSTAVISAQPANGYHFTQWSNGSRKANDTIVVDSDIAISAVFEAHTIVTDKAVAATCAKPGLTVGTHCSVCGEVIVKQETVTMEHTPEIDKAIAATCTSMGFTEGSHCKVCGAIIVAQERIPASHTVVVDSAVAATCTKTGLSEGSHCSVCKAVIVKQDTIKALSHTVVADKAVAATCTKTGLSEGSYCSVCGTVLVKQNVVPSLGHTIVVDSAKTATCTVAGLTEGKHCSVCDSVFVKQETIPVIDHKFTNYVYNEDATTEKDGTMTAYCDYGCGATDTRTAEGTKLTDIADESANGVVVYAHHNVIVVENATADIYVYDAMGRLVASRGVSEGSAQIAMPHEGIYIVKCGVEVKRVSVSRN